MTSRFIKTIARGTGVLLIVAAVGTLPAVASEPSPAPAPVSDLKAHHPPKNIMGIWRNPEMAESLGIDPEKLRQIRTEDFRLREKLLGVKSELDMACLKLDQAMTETSFEIKGILDLAARVQQLENSIFLENLASRLKLAALFDHNTARQLGFYDIPGGKPPVPDCRQEGPAGLLGLVPNKITGSDH
ncbi:MAG: hypothetical protein V1793_04340 [Pseudomonadota bacterium]